MAKEVSLALMEKAQLKPGLISMHSSTMPNRRSITWKMFICNDTYLQCRCVVYSTACKIFDVTICRLRDWNSIRLSSQFRRIPIFFFFISSSTWLSSMLLNMPLLLSVLSLLFIYHLYGSFFIFMISLIFSVSLSINHWHISKEIICIVYIW